MWKRLTLLGMSAVALVAFAVPAVARAAEVTDFLGEDAAEVAAVSENTIWTTGLGNWECDTVTMNLTGGGGLYHGTGTAVGGATASHSGPCKSGAGFHLHKTVTTTTIDLNTEKASITYAYQFTTPLGTLNCAFASEADVSYAATSSDISVSGTMTGSGEGCPTEGKIAGDFAVTSSGEPVEIH